jgi:hypothetical protein
MAEHLNAGGTIYDERAKHIDSIIEEMSAMRHFVRSTKHRQFEDKETEEMTQAAVHHYDRLKRTLRQMRGARGYRSYFECWNPAESTETQIDVDALRERFVKKVYDDRFTEALPIVYKAYKQYKAESANQLGAELEEWADDVAESTWLKPDTTDKATALQQLLKSPISSSTAQDKLNPLIGSDALNDELARFVDQPDYDVRPIVKKWLQDNMPELASKVTYGQNNGDDSTTNWVASTSPQQAAPHDQYGATTMDEPNVNESGDDLDFIRSLAGIRR